MCHDRRARETWAHSVNFDFDLLANLRTLDEDHKTLDLCDTVAASRKFSDFYVVFLTYFYGFLSV